MYTATAIIAIAPTTPAMIRASGRLAIPVGDTDATVRDTLDERDNVELDAFTVTVYVPTGVGVEYSPDPEAVAVSVAVAEPPDARATEFGLMII